MWRFVAGVQARYAAESVQLLHGECVAQRAGASVINQNFAAIGDDRHPAFTLRHRGRLRSVRKCDLVGHDQCAIIIGREADDKDRNDGYEPCNHGDGQRCHQYPQKPQGGVLSIRCRSVLHAVFS